MFYIYIFVHRVKFMIDTNNVTRQIMFIQPGNVPVAETAMAAAAYYVFSKTGSISRKSYIIMNPLD